VAYRDNGVTVWDFSAKKELAHISVIPPDYVADSAFIDDSRALVTILTRITGTTIMGTEQGNYSAVSWDVATAKKRHVHAFDPLLEFKALAPDGRYAVLMQGDVGHGVFDLASGRRVFEFNSGGGFCFSDDGSILVSYDGRHVAVWEVPSGKMSRRFEFNTDYRPRNYPQVDCLSLSPDKKVLAVGGFTEIHIVGLISMVSGKILGSFECCPPSMMSDYVRFSPDGRILATDTDTVDRSDRDVQPLLRFWKIPTPR
jgi:WD40 repeat protein